MSDNNLPPTPPGAVPDTNFITALQMVQPEKTVKPAHIDGGIVVLMGGLTALMGALDSDQAKAILHPMPLFIAQTLCLTINGGLVALNGFRSLVFAKSKE